MYMTVEHLSTAHTVICFLNNLILIRMSDKMKSSVFLCLSLFQTLFSTSSSDRLCFVFFAGQLAVLPSQSGVPGRNHRPGGPAL